MQIEEFVRVFKNIILNLQNLLDDLTSAHALLKEEEELRQTIAIKQNNDVDVKGDISKLHSLTRKHNLMKVTLRDDFDKLIEIKGNIEPLKGKEYKKAVDVQTYMTDIPGHIKTADDVGITVAQLGFSVEKTDEILKAFDSGSKGLGLYYRYDKDNPKNNRPAIPDMVKKMCF